ncbi:MAG TPA: histidine kinase [Puia sp.]
MRFPIAIAEDSKGDIWMAGKEGITRYNNQKRIFDTLVTNLQGIGSITGRWNSFVLDKQDNFWEAWKTNLIHWNTKTGIIRIYPMPGNPALESNYVKGPWMNRIWISTQGGLVLFDIQNEKFSILRKSDGLYGDELHNMANLYFDSSTKRIFAGFNNVFTWFYPDEVLKAKSPISTFIVSVRTPGDSPYFSDDTAYSLKYAENSIEIKYAGINYDDGENNTYAYRLYENKPGPFVNVGLQKTVTFANLRPGYYHFQVKTILMGGIESQVASTLHINILPPFYQTWWFYLLCFAAIASALYAFYRYRINQILNLQKIRNSIASDLHDDIGSTLSSISIMSELAKKKSASSMTLLDSIGETARLTQENMRDLVWAVNPRNDRFGNILQRMQQFASEILEARGITFQFRYDESIAAEKLSMEQRKKIYLFFKEAINNAAKYSKASQVEAVMQIKNGIVILSITDNGVGFIAADKNNGNGLSNFSQRALELGGKTTMHSEPGRGTRIELSFKII